MTESNTERNMLTDMQSMMLMNLVAREWQQLHDQPMLQPEYCEYASKKLKFRVTGSNLSTTLAHDNFKVLLVSAAADMEDPSLAVLDNKWPRVRTASPRARSSTTVRPQVEKLTDMVERLIITMHKFIPKDQMPDDMQKLYETVMSTPLNIVNNEVVRDKAHRTAASQPAAPQPSASPRFQYDASKKPTATSIVASETNLPSPN